MEAISIVLAMFMAVVVSGLVGRMLPFPIPLPLVQIVLGALIAGAFGHGVALNPELFFFLFLPPLLFLDGWRIPSDGLLRDKGVILQLAFGLVIFTVLGLGFLIHWMVPTMPLAVAFALAAIVSPTDPVAVSAITTRAHMPKRITHVLEGESLLNDASGLVAFRFAVAAAVTGSFSLANATLSFFWVTAVGLLAGIIFTLLAAAAVRLFVRRYGEETSLQILLTLLVPFGAYAIAEHLGASGILAAVAAGITTSRIELAGYGQPSTRLQLTAVWNTVQFTLNGIMFVLLGEQLPAIFTAAMSMVEESGHTNLWRMLAYAVGINVALVVLRFTWVWISLQISRFVAPIAGRPTPKFNLRLALAVSLAGVRGAVTLAGILTLPLATAEGLPFPARSLAIFLAATVIILSLLCASVVLPRLLRGLPSLPESDRQKQEDLARTASRDAALKTIKKSLHELIQADASGDPRIYTDVADRLTETIMRSVSGPQEDKIDADAVRRQAEVERAMRLAALQAVRAELYRLARTGQISDEVCRAAVLRTDLQEVHL